MTTLACAHHHGPTPLNGAGSRARSTRRAPPACTGGLTQVQPSLRRHGRTHRALRGVTYSRFSTTVVAASAESEASAATAQEATNDATFRVKLTAQEAKKAVVLGQVVKEGQQLIFVSAVGIGSDCEEAGVIPGQVLRAISHPTDKGELWNITGTERLRYVRDAIAIRRPGEEVELLLEREPSVTADDVSAAEAPSAEDVASEPATPAPLMGMPDRERDDLYSDNWNGDEYKGSNFNELTVGLGIAIATPLIGLLLAAATYGKLWGTSGYAYLGF